MTNKKINNVEEAVKEALTEAKTAATNSSYGVGGLLLNANTGEVLKVMHNKVIRDKALADPSAHGERQLVDWYYDEKAKGGSVLPEPKDVIVVTTLDPCYMCTGSILAAGFRAVVAAYDDNAGINHEHNGIFLSKNEALNKQITESFYYPRILESTKEKKNYTRDAFGNVPNIFQGEKDKILSSETVWECDTVFLEGLNKARKIVKNENEIQALNPATLSQDSDIIQELRKIYPDALKYHCDDLKPDIGLAQYLEKACKQDIKNGGSGNAVAFLDCFGNLLMCMPGNEGISPIRTAFMEILRAYNGLRHRLGEKGRQYLCATMLGSFVCYRGFDKSAVSLADMGAYGSSILDFKRRASKNLQYIVPAISQKELDEYISSMVERYTTVVKPMLVEDEELARWRIV